MAFENQIEKTAKKELSDEFEEAWANASYYEILNTKDLIEHFKPYSTSKIVRLSIIKSVVKKAFVDLNLADKKIKVEERLFKQITKQNETNDN